MTFRQVLDVLWRRLWIILVAVLVAVLAAGAYQWQQTPNYTSSTTVRIDVPTTGGALTGSLSGISIDVDPALITSPTVLDPAATMLGEASSSALYAATSSEAAGDGTADHVVITTQGTSPKQAQDRVTAVSKSYEQYLLSQITQARSALQERHDSITQEAVSYQAAVIANPGDSIAAANLTNALSTLSTLNNQLSAIDTAGAPLTIISPAPPGHPTTPSLLIVLALALTSGLIAGIGIALIRDQFDDRLRAEGELQELTGLTSLGALTYDRRAARHKNPLPAATSQRTPLNEGIRALRTTLQVLLPPRHAVVVITSVEPGDGKTFISANLAVAWARSGKRVILVGGDLRRPGLSTYFGDSADRYGLSRLLVERDDAERLSQPAEIDGLLVDTSYPGLRLLPAGGESDDPADLLANVAFGRIIAHLAASADVVVIDSPPALLMADAALLAAHADGVVVLTTVRRTLRRHIRETMRSLEAQGATVLGAVANRSHRRMPRSYDAYYSNRSSARLRPQEGLQATGDADTIADTVAAENSVVTGPDNGPLESSGGQLRPRHGRNRTRPSVGDDSA
ncbi:MAG TPA: polysaccharide biosynthesis tyrosine autokinase [Lacisediminihabitans sp.]|uniref:polysaccharide biosynthesis tyrosine autokinase n=1 Tax=Lacisediminihabitans sp. TaxID=2787631 RepID=UPI002ED9BCD1